MKTLSNDLAKILNQLAPAAGLHPTAVPGVHIGHIVETDRRPVKRPWRACLGFIGQGSKNVKLEREIFQLDTHHYTATPIQLPVLSQILTATSDKPFLCILVDLTPAILNEVASQLPEASLKTGDEPVRAIFSGRVTETMSDAVLRLAKLLLVKDDARVLGPLVVKELFYHLLKGPEGLAIRQFVRSDSKTHKITEAIYKLNTDLSEEIDVLALAKAANMSRSAFFKYFKEITSMSPIQYQKRLRLHEARRLMLFEDETAESSAFKVGYKSASQFSREYSRMFGNSPLRDKKLAYTNTRPLVSSIKRGESCDFSSRALPD